MNRNELVDAVAGKAELSKAAANKAVDAVFESITDALKGGTEVRLVGFGTFSVAARAASEGRNPRTGEKIKIAASKQPSSSPASACATNSTSRGKPKQIGRLAQLAEHLVYTEGVGGSNPSSPTIKSTILKALSG